MSIGSTRSSAAKALSLLLLASTAGCGACTERKLEGRWVVTRVNWGHGTSDLDPSGETLELRFRPDGRMEAVRNGAPWSTHRYDVGLRRDGWLTGYVALRISRPEGTTSADADSLSSLSFVGDHLIVFRGEEELVLDQPCCDQGSIGLRRVPGD